MSIDQGQGREGRLRKPRSSTFHIRAGPSTQGLRGPGVVPKEEQGSPMSHQTSWWLRSEVIFKLNQSKVISH